MRELSLEGELAMPKGRRLGAEQIVTKLRQIEVLQGQGKNIAAACKEIGTTEQTFYRWRKEYGGLNFDHAKRLKQLEDENGRLKTTPFHYIFSTMKRSPRPFQHLMGIVHRSEFLSTSRYIF